MDLRQALAKRKAQLAVGLVGFFLLVAGLTMAASLGLRQEDPEVKILSVDEAREAGSEVVVDVAGAVEKPGVYRLEADARVQDAVTAAGGLEAGADREWIAKYVNLAQPLVDGSKLYIPFSGENILGKEGTLTENSALTGNFLGESSGFLININTASAAQLESLWGIGDARAKTIIDNRPYQTIEELVDKKLIPVNVFEEIKDEISVY